MKNLIMTALAILVTTNVFATMQTSGSGKNSDRLRTMGSAFKQHSANAPKINSSDITMGYAGQDVSGKTKIIYL